MCTEGHGFIKDISEMFLLYTWKRSNVSFRTQQVCETSSSFKQHLESKRTSGDKPCPSCSVLTCVSGSWSPQSLLDLVFIFFVCGLRSSGGF